MYINKTHIAFANGLDAGIIADSRGHGFDFLIRNLENNLYLIMSDAEDGADSPSPDNGNCHSEVDGDPLQWKGHVSLRDSVDDDDAVVDGIFTGTVSECLQFMAAFDSVRPLSGFMIVQYDTETGEIQSCAHDGENAEIFESIEAAQEVIDQWFEDHGDNRACYLIVAYTNEEQRLNISALTV